MMGANTAANVLGLTYTVDFFERGPGEGGPFGILGIGLGSIEEHDGSWGVHLLTIDDGTRPVCMFTDRDSALDFVRGETPALTRQVQAMLDSQDQPKN